MLDHEKTAPVFFESHYYVFVRNFRFPFKANVWWSCWNQRLSSACPLSVGAETLRRPEQRVGELLKMFGIGSVPPAPLCRWVESASRYAGDISIATALERLWLTHHKKITTTSIIAFIAY